MCERNKFKEKRDVQDRVRNGDSGKARVTPVSVSKHSGLTRPDSAMNWIC